MVGLFQAMRDTDKSSLHMILQTLLTETVKYDILLQFTKFVFETPNE